MVKPCSTQCSRDIPHFLLTSREMQLQSAVGFMVSPKASLSPKGVLHVSQLLFLHKSIAHSASQVLLLHREYLPIVFPKSFSLSKSFFPCPSQVLHTVMTKPCTCQCVVPTLCFICYLVPRVPPLLGGGGGGVSGGGLERVDCVICISQLFQEHVSVDTRFRKVKLHQILLSSDMMSAKSNSRSQHAF